MERNDLKILTLAPEASFVNLKVRPSTKLLSRVQLKLNYLNKPMSKNTSSLWHSLPFESILVFRNEKGEATLDDWGRIATYRFVYNHTWFT